MKSKFRGNVMLLFTALIWGTAFVAQSEGMNYIQPFTYNAVRTLLGGLVLIPVILLFRRIGKESSGESGGKADRTSLKITVKGGIICGVVLFAASSFQQSGIVLTTAGKAGFITALYIVIVPLLELFIRKKTTLKVWICVMLAAAGFWLLCVKEGFTVGKGDLLVLCCALLFAVHIMVIDHFNSKNTDPMVMSCVQFFTAGALMLICMFLFEEPKTEAIFSAKWTILYAGVMSSGVAYTLQIVGQRHTDPASATLLMSLESVFAALSGWLILSESMSLKELSGCALVFTAVILAQIDFGFRKKIILQKTI